MSIEKNNEPYILSEEEQEEEIEMIAFSFLSEDEEEDEELFEMYKDQVRIQMDKNL